ncbi:MAG: cation:proton antiporter [Candidatus Hydrothermarchaeota archaeon]
MDFLFQLILILVFATVFGELFQRLNQPSVVGEIVAGILLGIFLVPSESIKDMANLGILFLLFLAGTEIDIQDLIDVGRQSTSTAIFGMVLPFSIGFTTSYLIWKGVLLSLFIGTAFTATSIGVTVKTLMDMDKLDTIVGRTIIGSAIIDDILGISLLGIVTSLSIGKVSVSKTFFSTLTGIFLIVVVLYIGIKTINSVATHMNKLLLIEGSFMVFIILALTLAYIAEKIGLNMVLGSFAAGIIIGKVVDHHLLGKISAMSRGFFIPIFFAFVGMSTHLGLSYQNLDIVFLFLVSASLSKVFGASIGSLIGGISPRESLVIGIGLMPRTEIALAVITVGAGLGIIPPEIFSVLVITFALTVFITPMLLSLSYRNL